MRRFGFAILASALASFSSAALAAPAAAPSAPAAKASPKAKAKPAKQAARLARAGTSTAGATGFLPIPAGVIAAFAGWGATATVIVTGAVGPASPE